MRYASPLGKMPERCGVPLGTGEHRTLPKNYPRALASCPEANTASYLGQGSTGTALFNSPQQGLLLSSLFMCEEPVAQRS